MRGSLFAGAIVVLVAGACVAAFFVLRDGPTLLADRGASRSDAVEESGAAPADPENAKAGRRRVGDSPAPPPIDDSAVTPDAADGPVTREQRLQWIREWMEIAFDPGYSFQDEWKAQTAIPKFDAGEAIPLLLEFAKSRDEFTPGRADALSMIGDFGARAGPFVPQILNVLLRDEEGRSNLAAVLGRIGEAAAPALIKLLNQDDVELQQRVLSALAIHSSLTREQTDIVLAFMTHADPKLRASAAAVFNGMVEFPDITVPALITAVGDEDGNVRRQALLSLMSFKEQAVSAVTALAAATSDDDAIVRILAVTVLGRIGPAAAGQTEHLIALLSKDPSFWEASVPTALMGIGAPALLAAARAQSADVRQRVIAYLGYVASHDSEHAAAATRQLGSALIDDDSLVRTRAAAALGNVGESAVTALPALLKAARDPHPSVRRAALIAAARVGGGDDDVLSVLIRELTDGPGTARAAAAEALESIGPKAAPAVEALRAALDDRDALVRRRAAEALGAIGKPAGVAASALAGRLADPDVRVTLAAAVALFSVDPPGIAARDTVQRLRVHDDNEIRTRLLVGIGRHPDALWLPVVLDRLEDRSPSVRVAAIRALGDFGALARPHVERLIERLGKERVTAVKIATVNALGNLGGVAADAASTLERMATERDWAQFVRPALDRIRGERPR